MSDADAWARHLAEDADQVERVLDAMMPRVGAPFPGPWLSKKDVARLARNIETHAVSARLSDLKKRGWRIEKKYAGDGVWLYRLEAAPPSRPLGGGASGA